LQNQDNKEQKKTSAEKLDASKMSAAELLEAVGVSSSLEDTLVRENDEKQAAASPAADSKPETDMQEMLKALGV
jgi:hypothetical protein